MNITNNKKNCLNNIKQRLDMHLIKLENKIDIDLHQSKAEQKFLIVSRSKINKVFF